MTSPSGPDAGWATLLDRLAASCAEQSALLQSGEPVEVPDPQLGDLGPVPAHLRARADQVLTELVELQDRIAEALAASRVQGSLVRRFQSGGGLTAGSATPSFVDQSC